MISKIMSKNIIFGNTSSSIKDICTLMKENNIGFVPIKEKEEYVGVITDRDIALSLPTLHDINDSIKSYMTKNIIYIYSNADVDSALDVMKKHKIKRLLVKEKDSIIGILSLSDILNYTNNKNIINTYKAIFYIHNNSINDLPEVDDYYL